ncbi:MAG: glycosyltransferase [Deltaproteobacteria bacterium]|nr:glycosyltransferase [Deltaproteobacteria bacterium]
MEPFALADVVLAALSLAAIGAAAVAGRRRLAALAPVQPAALVEPLLVVIPARDESANLTAHLPALLAEPAAELRVVVVDDRSSDETAAVVEEAARHDARLRLLRLTDEPAPGVFGKPRALAAAVDDAAARGELPALALFLDADVAVQPGLLGGLVATLRRQRAHALSGVPQLEVRSAVEALFLPTLVALVTGHVRIARVHDARAPDAFLNGQVVLCDTAALAQVGGWRAVDDTVLEDVALARRLKGAGLTLRLGDLRALAATRMYATFDQMARGFGKNAVALLGPGAGRRGLVALALSLAPWAALVLALLAGDDAARATVAALFALTLAVQASTRAAARVPIWPVLVLPVSYLGAALVLWRAARAHAQRAPIEWRGRRYPR